MISIEQIKKYKETYEELYRTTREKQREDEEYYTDTFDVPQIKAPHTVYRSGIGVKIVDSPAERIVTKNPQAFFDSLKGSAESIGRISKVVNQVWLDILRRQNPNIFKETVKQQLGFGESYVKVLHNESWLPKNSKKVARTGLPCHFIALNPMVIYGSPEEEVNGIPERVIVVYERQLSDLIVRYPGWVNPINDRNAKTAAWFEYWDKDVRYFSANDVPVLKGEVQPNPYGFVPFVRKYSGFGRRAANGDMSSLIVSDIRYSKGLILEECITRSNIASVETIYAHKPQDVVVPEGTNTKQIQDNYTRGAYGLNIFEQPRDSNVPITFHDNDIKPDAETYRHHAQILSELAMRHPFIIPPSMGVSGIQDDKSEIIKMRRYDSVVENTENMFAVAIEMSLKICKKMGILPEGLQDGDLDTIVKCNVKLRAVEAIEKDRAVTLGRRGFAEGVVSLYRLHTEFEGMTEDEHKLEVGRILADKATFQDPEWAAVVGAAAAREGGMEQELADARAKMQSLVQSQGLTKPPPPTTQQRTMGEVETEQGEEMGVTHMRGARRSPEGYERG